MDTVNKPQGGRQESTSKGEKQETIANPFENNQLLEKDIAQNREELDKEQQFKEAQRERD